jgi:transcriptional regulator with PAS, ATPase and Fis domain
MNRLTDLPAAPQRSRAIPSEQRAFPGEPRAILGESRAIRDVLAAVERVAATPRTTVLVSGESGVGKELVARAIHERSRRAAKPFVAVNCAALSGELLEAELFGYEGGAFTGARPKGSPGLFAAADGGTLLLDEIGELELELQAKLLRVLQERVYRRVGGDADLPLDVRIIASTNRDLPAMVAAGSFREDLFYRLNVMSVRVPPLRERASDVAGLAAHFLDHFAREFGRTFRPLGAETLVALERHSWPGNVRELANAIERAALLAPADELEIEHLLPAPARVPAAFAAEERTIKGVEKALILRVLEESEGNRSRAARVLGVNRATLYNKLRTYGIAAG